MKLFTIKRPKTAKLAVAKYVLYRHMCMHALRVDLIISQFMQIFRGINWAIQQPLRFSSNNYFNSLLDPKLLNDCLKLQRKAENLDIQEARTQECLTSLLKTGKRFAGMSENLLIFPSMSLCLGM